MTDVQSLRSLAAAIEAGSIHRSDIDDLIPSFFLTANANDAHSAYKGDLSAAKALHEAVLPEWTWEIGFRGTACVYPPGELVRAGLRPVAVKIDNPGRAWLLAIVRALIAWETME